MSSNLELKEPLASKLMSTQEVINFLSINQVSTSNADITKRVIRGNFPRGIKIRGNLFWNKKRILPILNEIVNINKSKQNLKILTLEFNDNKYNENLG